MATYPPADSRFAINAELGEIVYAKGAAASVSIFVPQLSVLPAAQRRLWTELDSVPHHFTLYGGTALALRLGHRQSLDFVFFSNEGFDPEELGNHLPFLRDAERVQVAPHTLTCRVDPGATVLVSFFGALNLGQVAPSDEAQGCRVHVASLADIAGTKAAVVQKRAEAKDYIDIDVLLRHGVDLPTALSAGQIIYGRSSNPLITLKALSYFDDVPTLSAEISNRLSEAVAAVDPSHLPPLAALARRPADNGHSP